MDRQLLTELNSWKQHPQRKPLLLKGARQVGKTWLLQHFGAKSFPAAHYINFEKNPDIHSAFAQSLSPERILLDLALLLRKDIERSDLIIFDEIQACPNALTALKYFAEDMPELAICAAGSHIGLAFAEGSFPVGKIDIKQLYPMSFTEFLAYRNPRLLAPLRAPFTLSDTAHGLLWKEFLYYHFCGGLPEAITLFGCEEHLSQSTIEKVRQFQTTILESYIADFSKHAGNVNASHLAGIFANIPKQLNQALDSSVSRYHFKGVIPNRSKYSQFSGPIHWLSQTGLILKNPQLSSIDKPLLAYTKENLFKLFYFDVGLLCAALSLSFRDILSQDYGSYKGFIAENVVMQGLSSANYQTSYWISNSNRGEIEFLIEDPQLGIIPIEVKAGAKSTRAKSLAAFKQKYQPAVAVKFSGMSLGFEKDQINAPLYLAALLPELLAHWGQLKT